MGKNTSCDIIMFSCQRCGSRVSTSLTRHCQPLQKLDPHDWELRCGPVSKTSSITVFGAQYMKQEPGPKRQFFGRIRANIFQQSSNTLLFVRDCPLADIPGARVVWTSGTEPGVQVDSQSSEIQERSSFHQNHRLRSRKSPSNLVRPPVCFLNESYPHPLDCRAPVQRPDLSLGSGGC
jgi:hypothetical protein